VLAAARGPAAGTFPLDAAVRCEVGTFAEAANAERMRIVLNLHRAYAEITGGH
jgi:hypothetical protein